MSWNNAIIRSCLQFSHVEVLSKCDNRQWGWLRCLKAWWYNIPRTQYSRYSILESCTNFHKFSGVVSHQVYRYLMWCLPGCGFLLKPWGNRCVPWGYCYASDLGQWWATTAFLNHIINCTGSSRKDSLHWAIAAVPHPAIKA